MRLTLAPLLPAEKGNSHFYKNKVLMDVLYYSWHVHLPNTYQKIPRILSGIVTGRVRTVMYLYHICRVTKKSLHLFIKCDKMEAIWENAAIGLPYIGLRPQRERDGGIRLRAMPGFLPGASA